MEFGLEKNIIEAFIEVFETNSKIDKALIFGSRAKGNYRPDSDIDISIKGHGITTNDIITLSLAFEAKGILYKIDLIYYNSIKEPALKEHIDRVGIEFYSRWKKFKIGDLINIEYGKGLKDYQNGKGKYDVFGTNGKIGTTNELLYDEPSVIIGRKGAYREVYFSKNPFFVIDTAFYSISKSTELNTAFLYYWFKTVNINEMDSGSAIPSTSRDELYDLKINLPPIVEQNNIASTLSSLDDKVDLLYRQNTILEKLAETLFKQLLVETCKEKGETKSFADLIETTLGGEWGKEKPEGEFQLQVQCIRGTDIADLETGIPFRTPVRYIRQKRYESIEIKDGDLVMEISGGTDNQSTGRTIFINGEIKKLFKYPLVFSNFCRLIRPRKKEYSFFLYLYIHHLYKQGDLYNLENGSSGIKNLNYKALLFDLKYFIPSEISILTFNKNVEILFDKITKNKLQILTLNQTRDTLLPKLVSGEVRIS